MTNSKYLLEICVDCLESASNAIEGGANRLELCSALSEGGLTPSIGLVKIIKRISSIPVFVMLRARAGNFVYNSEEMEIMLEDLKAIKEIGVDGFVFGALTTENKIDKNSCRKIIEMANPLPVTYHRAFDQVDDPYKAVDAISELGFKRLLTSGQKNSSLEGLELIAKLTKDFENRIIIMPGAGITEKNLSNIVKKSGASEYHASAKKQSESLNLNINVGATSSLTITDLNKVKEMSGILKDLSLRNM